MSRRPSAFTQADIARLCRGAISAGLARVEIELPSGVKFSIPLDECSAKGGFKLPALNSPCANAQNRDDEVFVL